MKKEKIHTERKIIRVDGKLREIITVLDPRDKVLQRIVNPVMLEFYPRDLVQVMVGASILAVPVAFTEETWKLGQSLPLFNTLLLLLLSIVFISGFVYYNYYRNKMTEHKNEFIKRVASTYLMSFVVVALILTIIGQAPWMTDWIIGLKRSIIVSFPSSMSAAIADTVK